MNGCQRKKTRRIPTNKERGACLARGYQISETYLGGGAMGRVFLAQPTIDVIERNMKLQLFAEQKKKLQVAVKIIYLDKGARKVKRFVEDFSREVEIMNEMFGDQKILQLLDVFVSCKRIFLVTEYVSGGSLKNVYRSLIGSGQKKLLMDEGLARYYFREVVEGVASLHRKSIAHRDLKLDNILITETGQIKVADLGFSVQVSPNDFSNELAVFSAKNMKNSTFCGTPYYMAPEVLRCRGSYDALCADAWSLGVILFLLTNSDYPYTGCEMKQVYCDIKKRGKDLPYCKSISNDCKDLIKQLLCYEPSKRLTVSKILNHPWVRKPVNYPSNYKQEQVELNPILLSKIADDPGYKQEAIYVRSYLLQRAKLLRIYRKKIKRQKVLPMQIYKEFGLPIAIPRQEGGDEMAPIEIWRIMGISIRSSDDDSDDDYSSDITVNSNLAVCPNYGLSLTCRWISDGFGSTVGVDRVRRVVKDLSTLDRWREFRNAKNRPITDLEKCIKLFNTVDLNVKDPWHFTRHTNSYLKPSLLDSLNKFKQRPKATVSKCCSDACRLFVRYHPHMGDVQLPSFVQTTSNLKAIDETSVTESFDSEENVALEIHNLASYMVNDVLSTVVQPNNLSNLTKKTSKTFFKSNNINVKVKSMTKLLDVEKTLENKIHNLASYMVNDVLSTVIKPNNLSKSTKKTSKSSFKSNNINVKVKSMTKLLNFEKTLENKVFEFPHFSDQKTFQTVHQPNISICMTETVSNNNFAEQSLSHLDLLGYTLNMNTYKFANSSQSTVEIDIEEDTATSLTSNLSTDIGESTSEAMMPDVNQVNVDVTKVIRKGTYNVTRASVLKSKSSIHLSTSKVESRQLTSFETASKMIPKSSIRHSENKIKSILLTSWTTNRSFSRLHMFTYTLNTNTLKSANASQSNMEIDLEEHRVTSFTSNLSTDIGESTTEAVIALNQVDVDVTRSIRKGTFNVTRDTKLKPRLLKSSIIRLKNKIENELPSSDITETLKDNKYDGRPYVPMPGEKNKQENGSHLSQSLAAIIVNNLSSSSVYPDSDKLSVDDLGRNYFVDRNVLGHITGAYSRSDSVVEQGRSSDEPNNEIRDKTRQALIAEQLVDACRSLILVRNGLALLNKLNGNVLNDILYSSLTFGNIEKDSEEYEMMSNHFKLLVGNALFSGGNYSVHSAPITGNVAGPSTSNQISIDQLSFERNDETVKSVKKLSFFSKIRNLFKSKSNKTSKPKKSRWKSCLNNLNCFGSTE